MLKCEAEKSYIHFTHAFLIIIVRKSKYNNIYTPPQSVRENLSILTSCPSWDKSWPYHSYVDMNILWKKVND